jgi:peptide/nickel transport system substrate-binding protein
VIRFLCIALALAGVLAKPAWADRLSIAVGYFPEQWGNPFSSTSITRKPLWSALFDPLALLTSDGVLLPWLAVEWQQIAPNQWEITLRDGVTFNNGETLTAASVVAAVAHLTGPAGRVTPVGRDLSNLVGAEATGKLTVLLETAEPDPLLPYKLPIVHPLAAQQWAELGPEAYFRNPPGTGPYTVEAIKATRATLKASPTSWRRAPAQTLEFLVLLEPAARQAALITGEADVAVTALSPDEFEMLRSRGGEIYTDRIPSVVALAYVMHERDSPFSDPRVREAMIYAVNRDAIVTVLMGGASRVANQPAPSGAFGYAKDVKARPYDPDRARALLREAGYDDGFSLSMEMPAGAVIYTDVFQQVAVDLNRVGIRLTIQLIPQARFLKNIQTGEWGGDAIAMPMFTPVGDALYPMRQNSCLWHAAYYCDPIAAALIETATAEVDLEKRRTATEAVMRYAHETAQALFLYETVSFVGLGTRIEHFGVDYGFIRYETITLKE